MHRLTFSRSLCEWIVEQYFPNYSVETFRFVRTGRLEPGTKANGLYGIIGTRKDIVLRIAMTSDMAELLASDSESRHIEEIFLLPA